MLKYLTAIMIACAALGYAAEAPIKPNEQLTLERCVAVALANQPSVHASVGAVDAGRARVNQEKSAYYPQVNYTLAYTKTQATESSGYLGTQYDQYGTGFTVNQYIYDFGQTPSRVAVQTYNLNAADSDLETTRVAVVSSVKQAYFSLLRAERNRKVSAETVKQYQEHLDQAKGFFSVGLRPKFDVTKAEVDLSNAKLSLIQAENAVKIARITLNNTLGIAAPPDYTIEDTLAYKAYLITLEKALATAFKTRPDLAAVIARRQSAEKSVDLTRSYYWPSITGSAAYNWENQSWPLERGWNVGLALSVPVFNGFLTRNQVKEAQANLDISQANEESVRQSIILAVKQAYFTLQEAEEGITTTELAVKQAAENREIANGRYKVGVGNPIEVTDAEVLYSNAQLNNIFALFGYKIAQVRLEQAMGLR